MSSENPLRYCISWSPGLINEYKDDCIVLENGQIKTVKGMDGLESVESTAKLEAFHTSGGHLTHSLHESSRVNNCSYKTQRYKGHGAMVKFLMRDCQLDDETLNKIFVEDAVIEKDEAHVIAKVERQ